MHKWLSISSRRFNTPSRKEFLQVAFNGFSDVPNGVLNGVCENGVPNGVSHRQESLRPTRERSAGCEGPPRVRDTSAQRNDVQTDELQTCEARAPQHPKRRTAYSPREANSGVPGAATRATSSTRPQSCRDPQRSQART